MLLRCFVVAASFLLASALSDGRPHANFRPKPTVPIVSVENAAAPVTSRNGTVLPPYNTTYFFQQLIDHTNPSLGTFTQRYWHTYEMYEPGGPILLFTPGEANAAPYTGYLTNATINGLIAQQQNGAAVVLEHRNPFPDLTVKSLKFHTIQQAIDDLEYFANNVVLPQPDGNNVKPDTTPWVLVGGSYSGALTSWTMVNKPGLFAAGYASSAVVEAIFDFWQYFEPERLNMPANCSADVQAVIAHIDQVFSGNDKKAIQSIKTSFGMGEVTHLDDVAGALRNNMWDWQSLSLTVGPGAQFFSFCDALEVKGGVSAPATGWGLDHALAAWSSYWTTTYLAEICGKSGVEDCLGSYNTSQAYWTDTTVDNSGRSWFWIVCNEVGYLQDGAPKGHPSLVTRLVQPAYDLRQCQQMFPAAFPSPPFVRTARVNSLYAGWNVSISNLFFANGIRDPWRYATVSAPGVELVSTPSQPIAVGAGFHCSDLARSQGLANPTVLEVQTKALAAMKRWLAAWKPKKHSKREEHPLNVEEPEIFDKPLRGFRTPIL
ncbi:serine carboxypeptidase S28-domain-containing protein [Mycena rebaudengoi]|nr:serine carboxypeptidase S28-domain-containing protein [Mycena rebaudengoi]